MATIEEDNVSLQESDQYSENDYEGSQADEYMPSDVHQYAQQNQDTISEELEDNELTDERNMTVPLSVDVAQQQRDMFFSCCDWEDARDAEKHCVVQQVVADET